MLRFPSFQSEEKELTGKALEFLAVFGLADRHQELARTSLMGSSADWRSLGRWPLSPSCCCWMSRPPA